jgi:hypothetical protein
MVVVVQTFLVLSTRVRKEFLEVHRACEDFAYELPPLYRLNVRDDALLARFSNSKSSNHHNVIWFVPRTSGYEASGYYKHFQVTKHRQTNSGGRAKQLDDKQHNLP